MNESNKFNHENIYVTGAGAVSPFGTGVDSLWKAVKRNDTCIKDGLGNVSIKEIPSTYSNISSQINQSKAFSMLVKALDEAMTQAEWSCLTESDGIILTTTTGLIELWEQDLVKYLAQRKTVDSFFETFKYEPLGSLLEQLCLAINFQGRRTLVTTACAASTQAMGVAYNWLKAGKVKRCLVGGSEVLSSLTVDGFKSLNLISSSPSKPFDKDRCGINLSEGSAFICLENPSESMKPPLARLMGTGVSCDSYHMTSPHPEGKGCYNSIQMALRQAKLSPEEISFVHAHGTGSALNDLAEGSAIANAFRECKKSPIVCSTKSVHGHMLALSGVLESIISIKALEENLLLNTRNLEDIDSKINVNVICEKDGHCTNNINYILKTTLGFGGTNGAVIYGKI